jgi:hypothetical protein
MKTNNELRVWDGSESFKGKHVVVVCEGGFGDMIMWCRYLPHIRRAVKKLTLDAPKELHRLMAGLVDEVIDGKDLEAPPDADFFVYSMEIPFLFRDKAANCAYLKAEPLDLPDFRDDLKVGIAWEGDPNHSNNDERSIPLKFFRRLEDVPGIKFFMLVPFSHNPELTAGCDDMDLYGAKCEDFHDTARLIQAMDVVVTVDTAVAHLAAALGKKTYCLVSKNYDHRWDVQQWYNSLSLVPQEDEGDWMTPIQVVRSKLCKMRGVRGLFTKGQPMPIDVLLTGGIGDVVALESHMDDNYLRRVNKVYFATRVYPEIVPLYSALPEFFGTQLTGFPDARPTDGFAFYNKKQVTAAIGDMRPDGWREVLDWSIAARYPYIEWGRHVFSGSRLLKNRLCVVRKNLPDRYVLIQPSSTNKAANRDFDAGDWERLLLLLTSHEIHGVIVNSLPALMEDKPEHPLLVDLSGQTTLPESVEILKGASGFVGIDSWLSVLAAQKFPIGQLQVKTNSAHAHRCKAIYFAPHKTFQFLVESVRPSFPSSSWPAEVPELRHLPSS